MISNMPPAREDGRDTGHVLRCVMEHVRTEMKELMQRCVYCASGVTELGKKLVEIRRFLVRPPALVTISEVRALENMVHSASMSLSVISTNVQGLSARMTLTQHEAEAAMKLGTWAFNPSIN